MPSFHSISGTSFLGPVVALNAWTFVMEGWMYAERIPAMQKGERKSCPSTCYAAHVWHSTEVLNERFPFSRDEAQLGQQHDQRPVQCQA